jgi:D-alanine-D-alanine ligase
MNMSEPEQFAATLLRGKLSFDEPMRRHTSWRAGGAVARLYQPADLEDLRVFLHCLSPDEPLIAVGLGSNLLVRDAGINGTVLLMHGALSELNLQSDNCVYVQAGVAGAKLARFAAMHNLAGAEFFAGIPGSVGGMLAMNAGCYGSEIWQHVTKVQVMTRSGELLTRTPEEYEISYRSVVKKQDRGLGIRDRGDRAGFSRSSLLAPRSSQEFFVGAWLSFGQGDADIARGKIKELLSKRIASQPLNLPNAGSVFRNPPNDYAARLIEQCGLKGVRIGGAQVSGKHANFIVNAGGATATDIENLIEMVRITVASKTGVVLHPEVRIIGETVNMNKQKPDLRSSSLNPRSTLLNPASFGKVAVLFGGRSAEREVSLKSGAAVLTALKRSGVDAHAFDPATRSLQALVDEGFDRAFIALHGRFGEDGTVQGALELLGIPYTGSGVMASALGMDKWRSKLVWQAGGLPVPEFMLIDTRSTSAEVVQKLDLPLFVKPANEGSSVGISKVNAADELEGAYRNAAKHDKLVIAERYIGGGEYTVAILGEAALPVIKIEPANEFYDYEAKYLRDDTRYLCPCGLDVEKEAEMQRLAKLAFALIGGQGWGRVDFLMSQTGQPYVLEVNTSPGMTDHSLVPMAARQAGMGFDELVLRILDMAGVNDKPEQQGIRDKGEGLVG